MITKLSQDKFKYIVVKTGYTARLVRTCGFVHYKKVDDDAYIETTKLPKKCPGKYHNLYGCDRCNANNCNCLSTDVFFIYDNIRGDGLYAPKGFNINKHISTIKMLIDACREEINVGEDDDEDDSKEQMTGFVVFSKPDNRSYVQMLIDYEYCRIFGCVTCECMMVNNKPFALIYDVDSESG